MKREEFEKKLLESMLESGPGRVWRLSDTHIANQGDEKKPVKRTIERWLLSIDWLKSSNNPEDQINSSGKIASKIVFKSLVLNYRKKRETVLFVSINQISNIDSKAYKKYILVAEDGKSAKRWCLIKDNSIDDVYRGLVCLAERKQTAYFPSGDLFKIFLSMQKNYKKNQMIRMVTSHFPEQYEFTNLKPMEKNQMVQTNTDKQTHLDRLEAESIYIIREVIANAKNPVMLYSVGKDSAVMLHIAKKAFFPSKPPFPLMHVDTRWKFQAMYDFRDKAAEEAGMDLIVHINPDGIKKNINPFDHGSSLHTDIMKTQGLKQALDAHNFDVAFGGARRDEEKSRAKERIFSFRNSSHGWDPKNQRPEIWNLYNCKKSDNESIRVFPLSNWTELDVWQYIYRESIPIVPLYFAAERPIINRNGMLIMVDDDRMQLLPNEKIQLRTVRFRTLGCYPLTGAIESTATDLSSIVLELLQTNKSERQGRAIDSDDSASMEKKKQEGYF